MGYERILIVDSRPQNFDICMQKSIQEIVGVQILSPEDKNKREALLKYSDWPYDEKWPDNIIIAWTDDVIKVSFFTGNLALQK